jgi:hypothetical protein
LPSTRESDTRLRHPPLYTDLIKGHVDRRHRDPFERHQSAVDLCVPRAGLSSSAVPPSGGWLLPRLWQSVCDRRSW